MSTENGFPAPAGPPPELNGGQPATPAPWQVPGYQQPPAYHQAPPAPPRTRNPAGPLPYHRLGRAWAGYRWYKPLLVGLIAVGLYVGALFLLTLAGFFAALLNPVFAGQLAGLDDALLNMDMTNPLVFVLSLGTIILMLPAILLATRILGARPTGLLSSVAGRLRWGWLGCCLAMALGVMAVSYTISFIIGTIQGEPFAPEFGSGRMWLMIGLTLLLVPVQAAAEEYVFRGYLMQCIGGWLRHPAFAIALPIPLFVFGHDYDLYGQLDVGLFALAAGWISWRTGGLEAALGLHIVNNVVIFGLGAVALADVNAKAGSLPSLIASALTMGAYVWVVVHVATRRKIARLREPEPGKLRPAPWQRPAVSG
ncbi:CPBP family intramembrane glutamic endopeptidase [Paeniglutamicibacter cryotolerans]|uniref:Membrane protease YdiL (CAAX protease family) n=1 Tax=Paeniglutamicibacter cryotolerans TaxID=670079 RepID=A0A839QJI3_9MICC|nr:CPBP family intramembrane glutamic endopeptidase [Paeniglutamicibacter cryotolerans]MBB2994894.1 membrane protease YdiL (CAAX protease family) [Paeniglutamicibacter cryotolerans]